MIAAVLDASALLAALLFEPGGELVRSLAATAAISAVNYSETGTRLIDLGVPVHSVPGWLSRYQLDVIPFDQEQALAAAALRPLTRHLGLSLGDRACLALAQRLGLPAMTADSAWSQVDLGIPVQVIR